MSKKDLLIAYLNSLNYKVEIDQSANNPDFYELKWIGQQGDHCYTYSDDIAYNGKALAWLKSSDGDVYRLHILAKDYHFIWEPKTYNPFFGCLCFELEWVGEHLIFVYQDKHDVYITDIHNQEIKSHSYHGSKFKFTPTRCAFQSYSQELNGEVTLLQIPSLEIINTISVEEAKHLGLEPEYYH